MSLTSDILARPALDDAFHHRGTARQPLLTALLLPALSVGVLAMIPGEGGSGWNGKGYRQALIDEGHGQMFDLMAWEPKSIGGLQYNLMRNMFSPRFVDSPTELKEVLMLAAIYCGVPAANHAFYMRNCYLENRLSRGQMMIGGKMLDLKKVMTPIYNLATREDHIAPPRSVFLGSSTFGGPVDFILAGSGHIAGVVNPPDRNKYQFWTGGPATGQLDDWVKTANEHAGSWWPHWKSWISEKTPDLVKARIPGKGKLKAIEDAPGSYVKVRD